MNFLEDNYCFYPPEIGVSDERLLKLIPTTIDDVATTRAVTAADLGVDKWWWPVGLTERQYFDLMFRVQSLRVKCFRVGVDDDGRAQAPEAAWLIPAEDDDLGRMIWRAGVVAVDASAPGTLADSSGLDPAIGWPAFRRLANQDHFFLPRGRSYQASPYTGRFLTPDNKWVPNNDPYSVSPWDTINLNGQPGWGNGGDIDVRFQQNVGDPVQIDQTYQKFVCARLKWECGFILRYRDGNAYGDASLEINFEKSVQYDGLFYPYMRADFRPDPNDTGAQTDPLAYEYNYNTPAEPLAPACVAFNFTTDDPLDNANTVSVPLWGWQYTVWDPGSSDSSQYGGWASSDGAGDGYPFHSAKLGGLPRYTDTDGVVCPGFTFDVRLGKFYDYDGAYNTGTGENI